MRIREHISALPAALAPEMKTVARCSLQSLLNVAYNVAAIVTRGYFDQLNEIADNDTGYDKVPQSLFLMAATIISPTFRVNLSDGEDYRKKVGGEYSPNVDDCENKNYIKCRRDAIIIAFQFSYLAVYDLAVGVFYAIRAASKFFSDAKLNKGAICYLGGLDGIRLAMNNFRDAVAITPSWIVNVDSRRPLLE